MRRHIILFFMLAAFIPAFAQQPDDEPSSMNLQMPSNITHEVFYDPVTGQYTFKHKVGDFEYKLPTTMSQKDYLDYKNRKEVRDYWKARKQQSTKTAKDGNSIIPPLYVGGEAFDLIFGSNTIDIRPQGSVDLSFGIKSNYRGDPSITKQTTTNFDFDQDIQLNVIAKIGDKINFNISKNTKATFNYEDLMKLKYEGKEDEIIQLLEAGNVSFPLNSTLITGTQQLFGLKSKLKFGKTTISAVVSYQESESRNIAVQGGAQTNEFVINCLDYEDNRHFFLSQFFREQYEAALATLPTVTSSINITRVEVWITNTNSTTTDTRNILALTDLGEGKERWIYNSEVHPANTMTIYPRNAANNLLTRIDTSQIRDISTVTRYMAGDPMHIGRQGYMVSGRDFEKIENARRLSPSEFSLNTKLGFISLNINLNPNQTLAVAYQYTIVGSDEVYQVGEFSDQGVSTPQVLTAKLLRGTTVNTTMPIWNLMMKNVYNIRAYQISASDFMLYIFYTSGKGSTPVGYFDEGPENVKGVSLLHLLGLDNLTQQNNPIPGGDGEFDFINGAQTNGGTINAANGRIYFPVLEPFGSHLREVFAGDPDLADKYAYDSLYTMTKTSAEQYSEKNKFVLKGHYSSQSGSEISLNAMNVAQGSVTVTAGGRTLVENVDYTVDYTLGRVSIINEGILNSGTPINISMESNTGFSALKKTFLGARVEHEFNPDFRLGGTVLYLGEKSYTQKINYGEEAIANTIYGFDLSYNTEARWLTSFIDWLPGISTKAPSRIRFDGEFARFIPGLTNSASEKNTSYIDDFEGAKSTIDLRLYSNWHLASTPQHQTDLFPETDVNSGWGVGKNRAKLAWYTIDHTVFYDKNTTVRPRNITADELSKHSVRQVLETELFPTKDIAAGTPTNISVLNLAFFPNERGPYNYDINPSAYSAGINENGELYDPQSRWAGIMRKMETTDFEATNIEYVEFWLMDPFADPEYQNNPGKLYINLGDISEDMMRDGRKFYENGLPEDENVTNVDTTIWGRVPIMQDLVGSFSTNPDARSYQDVGYDGLRDVDERSFFEANYLNVIREQYGEGSLAYQSAFADPSSDNYHYFRSTDWNDDELHSSIIERYKYYNGNEGNSPSESQRTESYSTSNTTLPDGEDVNSDNTLSESERYYQYEIDLSPEKMVVGQNHIADIFEATNVKLANGETGNVTWYQFRVPIKQPDRVIGHIDDYSSIRFMRMFVRDFRRPIVLRFATLDLVKGEWRTYTQDIQAPGEYQPNDIANSTTLDVSAVNIEENGRRYPVPYVIPPGITQEQIVGTTAVTKLNEQSLQMNVQNLVDGDGRAIYKTTQFDLRQYKYLKMFVHAEQAKEDDPLYDQDLTVFMRLGTDFTENYYEYEIPLKITPWETPYTNKELIWPEINNIEILLEDLVTVKSNRNAAMLIPGSNVRVNFIYSERFKKGSYDGVDYYHTIKVIGNPTISDVRSMMIGIRNPKRQSLDNTNDDGLTKSAIVWVNELRLTELSSKGGFAGTGHFEATLADLGRFVASGSYFSGGFGSLDSRVTDNTFEANSQFSLSTDLELGKFVESTGLKLPLHVDYGKNVTKPIYNPYDPDVRLDDALAILDKHGQDSLRSIVTSMTQYKNINLMNVRKERTSGKGKRSEEEGKDKQNSNPRDPNNRGRGNRNMPTVHIWDIENFNLSFSYSETNQENPDIQYYNTKLYRGNLGYNYVGNPKNVAPFAKAKWASSPYLAIIKDINFYYLPKSLSFSTEMNRNYSERLMRNKSGGEMIINPTYSKQWDWNRNYQFRFDLTKGLNIDYSAQAESYIYEPAGNPDKGTEEWRLNRDTIKNELLNFGSLSRYHQTVNVNYTVPINKLPFLSWVTASATYQGQFFWTASARSMQNRLGNTVENSYSIQGNANVDLTKVYNSIPYLKDLSSGASRKNNRSPRNNLEEKGNKNDKGKTSDSTSMKAKDGPGVGKVLLDGTLKILTLVKRGTFTYSRNGGQVMPGYMPGVGYLGIFGNHGAPGWDFALGIPSDFYDRAINNGWITTDSILSDPYIKRTTETMNYRVNCEPFNNFKIDIQGNSTYTENFQQYFRANSLGEFEVFTPTMAGSYTSSALLIRTAFTSDYGDGDDGSPLFDQMLANRSVIADRLAKNNTAWVENVNEYVFDTLANAYFPKGYSAASTEVLLYSFLSAYSGQDPNNIRLSLFYKFPYPNWTLTFNGLTSIPAIGEVFKTFNITHGYRSTYSISNWASNVYYDENNPIQTYENSNDIISAIDLTQIVLNEQFSPLVGIDIGFKNSLTCNFQFKKSRSLTMSFTNNQLTEVVGREIVIGAGYRIKGLKFNITSISGNGGKRTVSNDLVLKVDLGFKKDKTTLRRADENNSQVSAGQNKINIYITADYQFSSRLSAQAFFKRDANTPFVSTSFPTSTTFAGIMIRFNLAQ